MKSYRGNAIAVGVLFIPCSAASILSIVPLGATVGAPVDFAKLAGSDNAVVMTALIEFVWAATGMGIAIALYPVLRLFNPTLALGSVVGRVVENVFILIGSLMYSYVLYRSRLIPRWLSGWGLVGAALSLVATVYAGFTQDFGFTTVNNVLSAPIGLQEMVLAVWLIAKGFNLSAVRSIAPSAVRSMTP